MDMHTEDRMLAESDARIVARVLGGDREAYAFLVARHERAAWAVAARVLGELHLADDAAQEALVLAYRKLTSLRNPSAFGYWLMKIARRQALRLASDHRRQQQLARSAAMMPDCDNGRLDPHSAALLETMDGLRPQFRQVLMLHYFHSHSVKDIAAMSGRTVGTVTKQLTRAREQLRRRLEGRYDG